MKTQTIEVEGLPEGWKAVEIRVDPDQYNKYVGDDGCLYWEAKIKMEKIQPRRIVLEEDINDNRNPSIAQTLKLSSGRIIHIFCPYAVREVKETDIPLTNDEPYLKLSVDQLKTWYYAKNTELLKTVLNTVYEFIKDK